MRDPFEIIQTPDRHNITLHAVKVPDDVACMNWLIDVLDNDGTSCPKTIVYCRSYQDCSKLYRHFLSCFGPNGPLESRMFDMVHSKTPEIVKKHVEQAIQDDNSNLRILIATKVIGMGLDINVDFIVHFGLPSTVEDYLQQIGRAGRRGQHAYAVMLYSGKQYRNIEAEMMQVVRSGNCLRQQALTGFGGQVKSVEPAHLCCNICKSSCECGSCENNPYEKAIGMAKGESKEDSGVVRFIDSDSLYDLKVAMYDLKNDLDRDIYMDNKVYGAPEVIHGLSLSTINALLSG
jgi:ATP-dependent DNA helicase RecQ